MAKESLYKDTVNLPKTPFPMKAELAKREPAFLAAWEKENIYARLREQRKNAPKFILHDGPPYANGDIHMGHALNKVLKDMILKYKTLRGFDTPYIPGWDCHGLPVEHQLFKEMGKTKHEVDQVEFRKEAQRYANRFVGIQRKQFQRLGIFAAWDEPYLTMAPPYEAAIVESFLQLLKGGYVYQGTRPIHWCVQCETALAEAELEYKDHESFSITVRFAMQGDLGKMFPGIQNPKILIWTTTPWTLPANLAVAVKADFQYSAVRVTMGDRQEDWIMAQELVAANMAALGIKEFKLLGTARGDALEDLAYRHPLLDREGKVLLSDFVTLDQGTGCVHIAPGHGQEDHEVGLRYGLPILSPVNDAGKFTADAGPFAGQHVFKANRVITDALKEAAALVAEGKIQHSYPHCWRCQKPVIFRATAQWFIRVDHQDLRSRAMEAIAQTQWIPARGQNRIASMVETRPDWCLSRQRLWGVPIPAVRCADCGHPVLTPDMVEKFLAVVREKGTDVWLTQDAAHWVPQGMTCERCQGKAFKREHDILDVWFDSGVSHQAVLKQRTGLSYPADLYLEGSDQHRGWFQSALLTAVPLEKKAPFRGVLTHGFVTDAEGKKMSKSQGNVIAPAEVVEKFGADVLRLWVACVDYTDDVRLSNGILEQVSDAYRKIRNTLRFLLGNTADFDPRRDGVAPASMGQIDRWALFECSKLINECAKAYDAYEFYRVYRLVYDFCVLKMSALYMDVLKDRLYTLHTSDPARRSSQTALMEMLKALTLIVSPILPFTAEETWTLLREKDTSLVPSVHLALWPALSEVYAHCDFAADWETLFKVREEVLKLLETLRQSKTIGSSLEAAVTLAVAPGDTPLETLLLQYEKDLASVFIVSQARVARDKNKNDSFIESAIMPALRIRVQKAQGAKCERCWVYSDFVGTHAGHPTLCEKCVNVVEKISGGKLHE